MFGTSSQKKKVKYKLIFSVKISIVEHELVVVQINNKITFESVCIFGKKAKKLDMKINQCNQKPFETVHLSSLLKTKNHLEHISQSSESQKGPITCTLHNTSKCDDAKK